MKTTNLFKLPIQKKLFLFDNKLKRLSFQDSCNLLSVSNLPFYFFGSSSQGNSVYLSRLHLLIDLGFPYNHYADIDPDFFLDVESIILTHEHGDHFNFSTFKHVLKQYPNVHWYITKRMFDVITTPKFYFSEEDCDWITTKIRNRFTIISEENKPIIIRTRDSIEYWFIPHFTRHGIGVNGLINLAIEISSQQLNIHTLYASDLDHLFYQLGDPVYGLPIGINNVNGSIQYRPIGNPFNYIFLEANYDTATIKQALTVNPQNAHAHNNLRHISEDEAFKYVRMNLSSSGIFVPLHASTTFGTLVQNLNSTTNNSEES